VGPGSDIWRGAKLGLGVAALFGCVMCGAVAVGMGVADAAVAVQNKELGAAAWELAGVATLGAGTKVKQGLDVARSLSRQLRSVPKESRTAELHKHGARGLRQLEIFSAGLEAVDMMLLGKDGIDFGLDLVKERS
jgi:hypothetical protein